MPTILMIHGMWSRPSTFLALRKELEMVGLNSCAITLPHHDLPPGSPAPAALGSTDLNDYVTAILREINAIDGPIILLGHSMGGLLAQKVAEKIQPKGLILLSSAPSAQAGAFGAALSSGSLQTLWPITKNWGWWNKPTFLPEAQARSGVFNGVPENEIRPALSDMTWDSGRVLAQISAPFLDSKKSARVNYDQITCPALVVTGRDDRIVPAGVSRNTARLLSEKGSRVDYEEWSNVGHWLFHDAVRPKTASAIARFTASLA